MTLDDYARLVGGSCRERRWRRSRRRGAGACTPSLPSPRGDRPSQAVQSPRLRKASAAIERLSPPLTGRWPAGCAADPPRKGERQTSPSAPRPSATSPSRWRRIAACSADRRADYHDAALPPHHALVAFGLWLRHALGVHALVHVGAHGTLEWLPGKTVALTQELLSRNRHRRPAGHLSLHRQQSRRGGPGQAPHRRHHARPPAAAAVGRRAGRGPAEARAPGRRICAGRRARPPPPRPAGQD